MYDTAQLEQAVRARLDQATYAVSIAAGGFDIRCEIDVPDWIARGRAAEKETFVHHVRTDEANGTLSITDETLRVGGGVGMRSGEDTVGIGGGFSYSVGRSDERVYTKQIRLWGKPKPDEEATAGFDTGHSRSVVEETARSLGWTVQRSAAAGASRIARLIGLTVAALTVLAVVVIALSGGFSS